MRKVSAASWKWLNELDSRTEVIFVAQDAAEEDTPAAAYRVRRNDAASYRDAFSRVSAAHGEVDAVLYLWGLEDAGCAQDPAIPMQLLQGLASSGLKCGRLLLAWRVWRRAFALPAGILDRL